MKRFSDLTEQEILALAITNEEEDSRIYRGFAEGLREAYPASAKVFEEMADEGGAHERPGLVAGDRADFVLFDFDAATKSIKIQATYVGGRKVWSL